MVLAKLAFSNFSTHKIRVALTIAAIALSVSLVVSVTSGYASAESAAFKFLSMYMGSHDAQLTRSGDLRGGIPERLCDELVKDPDVKGVVRRLEMESGMLDTEGNPIRGRPATVFGIRKQEDAGVEKMQLYEGGWFETNEGDVAVIDQAAARVIKTGERRNTDPNAPTLHVGDTFELPGVDKKLTLKVVGIVHKPAILAAVTPTIYVPLKTLQQFAMATDEPQVSRVLIDLQDNADAAAFGVRWKAKLEQSDPMVKMRLTSDAKSQLDQNLEGLHVLSYLGGMISMISATFIVFSSLSMGVSERQRTLAMLRAIGAFRSQLGLLVVMEGMALAVVGVLLGIPLGMLWTKITVWKFDDLFAAGLTVSRGGLLLASIGSVVAAVLASFLPAFAAMRVSPLEAMTPLATQSTLRWPIISALVGLLLIAIDPVLMFGPWSREVAFFGHFVVGLPGVMLGFFLLAPMFVIVMERLAGPIVAAMFGIRYAMLRQQLSGGIWRAAGTCAALMVGLAILVVLQTQGNTMLAGWRLPDKFPDIFIITEKFGGLNQQESEKLKTVPGVRNGEIMPIAISSPELGSGFFAILGAAVMPDATMFFGIDPEQAMEMMELDFQDPEGKSYDKAGQERAKAQAIEMLKKGRHLIVTQEFHELKGLHVGDKIPLKTAKQGVVEYTIAGVVWSPGIDVIVSMYDMGRQFDQRTAASVFGSLEDARNDFGVTGIYLFAANLEIGKEKEEILQEVKQAVGAFGMRAGDVRQIKYRIQVGLRRLLLLVSTVAFCAMAVASLGVTNTIMASIRSRRWQFGVLRSIGVTRDGLLRMVLAEAVLLGIVGCGLGLIAGMEMAINARRLSRIISGYHPPLDVPWGIIVLGASIVMAIALVASLLPAITVAKTEPLELLQAGRAAS